MDTIATLRESGSIGTGKTDDTAKIQAAVDSFCRPGPTGVIAIPPGVYRLTRPLTYSGDWSYGLTIRGGGSAAGPSGTVLLYDGPPGGSVVEIKGGANVTIERLAIHGNNKAKTGIAITVGLAIGTSGVYLDQVYIEGCAGPNSSAVAAGFNPDDSRNNGQCDRIVMTRCTFQGHGKTAYGFRTGWSNCKNFAVRDCGFTQFVTGISHGGSGFMIVDGFVGGGNTGADFEAGTGNLEIRAGNSEYSTRLLRGVTNANPGSVTIQNFSFFSDRTPGNGVIIDYQGYLKLTGCDLRDGKWPGAVPIIRIADVPGTISRLDSTGNFYMNAGEWVPAFAANGKYLSPSRIRSWSDTGGTGNKLSPLRVHP